MGKMTIASLRLCNLLVLLALYHFRCAWAGSVRHFSYEVVKEFEHPSNHFTQGFTFRLSDGTLLEGTGLSGKSVVAVYGKDENGSPTQPKTLVKMPGNHFGEGIAEFLGKLYQLTWQDGKVHVWDVKSIQHIETRNLPNNMAEGWGVCTSPGHDALIMSDGSAKLFWVVPDATADGGFTLRREVVAKDCENMKGYLGGLNELESVPLRLSHPDEARALHTSEGAPNAEHAKPKPSPPGALVYANVYGSHCVAMIDPVSGIVKGYLHLDGLNPESNEYVQVTNGVAYRDEDDSLWVTGKNWAKMFKIKLKRLEQAPEGFPGKCQTSWARPHGVKPKEKYPNDICPKGKHRTDL